MNQYTLKSDGEINYVYISHNMCICKNWNIIPINQTANCKLLFTVSDWVLRIFHYSMKNYFLIFTIHRARWCFHLYHRQLLQDQDISYKQLISKYVLFSRFVWKEMLLWKMSQNDNTIIRRLNYETKHGKIITENILHKYIVYTLVVFFIW